MMSSGTVGGMPSLAFLTNNRSKQCRDALPLLLVLLLLLLLLVVVAVVAVVDAGEEVAEEAVQALNDAELVTAAAAADAARMSLAEEENTSELLHKQDTYCNCAAAVADDGADTDTVADAVDTAAVATADWRHFEIRPGCDAGAEGRLDEDLDLAHRHRILGVQPEVEECGMIENCNQHRAADLLSLGAHARLLFWFFCFLPLPHVPFHRPKSTFHWGW